MLRVLSAEGFVRNQTSRPIRGRRSLRIAFSIVHHSHLEASDAERPLHFFCARFPPGSRRPLQLLRKGEAHACGHKIAPSALLTARLFPDMFPLTGQVQAACDTAKRVTGRLVGVQPPRFEDNEATFEELYARIQRTL